MINYISFFFSPQILRPFFACFPLLVCEQEHVVVSEQEPLLVCEQEHVVVSEQEHGEVLNGDVGEDRLDLLLNLGFISD